jgi:HK97 gp10 family phage protein
MSPDMNGDVQKFKADIPKIAEVLNKKVSDVVKWAALACVAEIIPHHPVDTGYSRANWRIGMDEPNTEVSAPPAKVTRSKKGKVTNKVPMRKPTASDIKKGALTVLVTNSVHYVRWLENGTNRTPPLNFVKDAAQRVAARMNEFVRKAKQGGGSA